MELYPSNSNKSKGQPEATEVEPKKVEKIIEGDVLRRKKPLGKKFMETFIYGDIRTVGNYVLLEVLLPAAKDTIADVMSQGVEKMLFGEARSTSRRTGNRPTGTIANYISYNKYANSNLGYRSNREDLRRPSRRARALHEFDEIILATRIEAEEVIDRLFDLISRYESATVADLYELVGIPASYPDSDWGWTDIRGAGVNRVRNGYLLNLPKPEPLG